MNESIREYVTKRRDEIVNQLLVGGGDEYKIRLLSMPFDMILAPIHVPMWMFRKFEKNPELNLNDIEKMCLSAAIHFTRASTHTGYMECSGLVEKYCMCDVEDVNAAMNHLLENGLLFCKELTPDQCYGHKRNRGFIANIPKLRDILSNYNLSVWT